MFPSFKKGANQSRTGDRGVADLCLTTWPWRHIINFFDYNKSIIYSQPENYRSSDSNGNRTRVTAVKGRCLNRLTMEP